MTNVYSKDYLKKYEVKEEKFWTRDDPDARKTRNARARELRKQGWTVETETQRFDTCDLYMLTATRKRETADGPRAKAA